MASLRPFSPSSRQLKALPSGEIGAGAVGGGLQQQRDRGLGLLAEWLTSPTAGKGQGPQLPWDLVPSTCPQLRTRPGSPCQTPAPSGQCSEPSQQQLPVKPQRLPSTQPPGRLSPLLLLIGHDQAGVQDVLLRFPRAVPGERDKGSELTCPLPHHPPFRGRSRSTRPTCLQDFAPS